MAVPIGRQSLYDSAGRRRPDAEVLREVGDLGLRTALLADAVHRRAGDEPCAFCGEPAVAGPGGECPVCRAGRVTERDHIPL
jgi:hypothetical protein